MRTIMHCCEILLKHDVLIAINDRGVVVIRMHAQGFREASAKEVRLHASARAGGRSG
eukprot:COSAG02_NODE_1_length_108762_cov_456.708287_95_plen_57_part_00